MAGEGEVLVVGGREVPQGLAPLLSRMSTKDNSSHLETFFLNELDGIERAIRFACRLAQKRLSDLGAQPTLREADGKPFVTDNGNWILDCSLQPVADPARLEADINAIPGVMENGLFITLATEVIVARLGSIEVLVSTRQIGP